MPMTDHDRNENHFGRDMVISAMRRCTNEKDILDKNPRVEHKDEKAS